MRRHHLGGALGAALLKRFQELRWLTRIGESRALRFTTTGEAHFLKTFGGMTPQQSGV
jgi:hypothetical protein